MKIFAFICTNVVKFSHFVIVGFVCFTGKKWKLQCSELLTEIISSQQNL